MNFISETKFGRFGWTNVTRPDEERIKYLRQRYGFLFEDLRETLPPIQRAKLVERQKYIFLILLFPYYNRETKKIQIEEIDFFILKNRVVTVHNNKIPVFENILNKYKKIKFGGDAAAFLYLLLDELINFCFPMLRHINMDIAMIENKLFKTYLKRSTVEDILRIKTNIFDFERAVKPQEFVLGKLAKKIPQFFGNKKLENAFSVLLEYAYDINTNLGSYKDGINALHEADSTLVEYRVNQIIKTLTIISVITFPLTLIATIFSMKSDSTPIVGTPYDFWKIVGILIGIMAMMLLYFKKRRWI